MEVNDGSYFKNLQIIIEPDKLENYGEVSKLNVGAAICAEGQLCLLYTSIFNTKFEKKFFENPLKIVLYKMLFRLNLSTTIYAKILEKIF